MSADPTDESAIDHRDLTPPEFDAAVDAALDRIDDGTDLVGGLEVPAEPDALPFALPVREHFAGLPSVPVTGDARVDAALARIDELPDLPGSEHVEVYEDIHRRLHDALSDAEIR